MQIRPGLAKQRLLDYLSNSYENAKIECLDIVFSSTLP